MRSSVRNRAALMEKLSTPADGIIEPTEEQMAAAAQAITAAYGSSVEQMIQAGGLLRRFEEKIVAGAFKQFIENHLRWARTQVYRLMWAHDRFQGSPHLGQYEISALYRLSAPKTPQKATDEARKLAGKGVFVSHQRAVELVAKHSPARPPTQRTRSIQVNKAALQGAAKSRKIDLDKLLAVLQDVGVTLRWEDSPKLAV